MSPVTAELVQHDLDHSATTPDQRQRFAQRAHLHEANVFPGTASSAAIELALGPVAAIDPYSEALDELISLRTYFEAVMALEIALDPRKRDLAAKKLKIIQDNIRSLWDANDSSPAAFDQCWRLDGDFHRELCQITGHRHLAEVVDIVLRVCKLVGTPRLRQDIIETWREHGEILEAIAAAPPDEDRIFQSIEAHIGNGRERWFPRRSRMQDTDMAVRIAVHEVRAQLKKIVPDLEEAIDLAIRDAAECNGGQIPQSACDLLRASLVTQYLKPRQFVVYVDDYTQLEGVERVVRQILHASRSAEEALNYVETLPDERRQVARIEYQPDPYCAASSSCCGTISEKCQRNLSSKSR